MLEKIEGVGVSILNALIDVLRLGEMMGRGKIRIYGQAASHRNRRRFI